MNYYKRIGVFGLVFLLLGYIGYSSFKGTVANIPTVITYEDFGAVGDGVTNDYKAIKDAHDHANELYINEGVITTVSSCNSDDCSDKNYYMGSSDNEGEIKIITNVDWKNANFIVDDYIDNNNDSVNDVATTDNLFAIVSPLRIYADLNNAYVPFLTYNDDVISYLSSNKTINSETTNLKYLVDSLYNGKIVESDFYNNNKEEIEKYFKSSQRFAILVTDSTKQFIRKGVNQDSGYNQFDMIIIDSITGDVLTDINWEYDDIIDIKIYPIADYQITVGNGNFTTYTNNVVFVEDSNGNAKQSSYSKRNITAFYAGNVKLHNIDHFLDETKHPHTSKYQDVASANLYYGFIRILNSAYIDFVSSNLSIHTPASFVSNNQIVSGGVGTYDLIIDSSANVFLDRIGYACLDGVDDQICYNDNIINENKWGIMGSNTSKNVFITNSKLNRIDAHRGITNLYVADTTVGIYSSKGSFTLGGSGYFYGKNLKLDSSNNIIGLRSDYGSTWDGTIVLDGVDFIVNKDSTNPYIIAATNEENWDFGYNTYFPNLYINNLNIDTSKASNVEYIDLIKLSSLSKDSNITIDKSNSRNLYNFKDNIYINGINTNGNTVNLFNNDFINSSTDTLNMDSYGGTNIVNLYLDENVVVDNKISTHNNPKFNIVDSMIDKTSEVEEFFDDLRLTSKMPESLKPLIGKIYLSDGKIKETIDKDRISYTAEVDADSITIDLETLYVGTYANWKTKTINLVDGDNVLNFSVNNSNGDVTNYTLNIIKSNDNDDDNDDDVIEEVDMFTLKCPNEIEVGKTLECSISINAVSLKVKSVSLKLDVSNELEYSSFTPESGWNVVTSNRNEIAMSNDNGISGNNKIGIIKFYVPDNIKTDSVSVGVNDIRTTEDGETFMGYEDISLMIEINNNNTDDDDNDEDRYSLTFDMSLSVLYKNKYVSYIKEYTTVEDLLKLITVVSGEVFVEDINNNRMDNLEIIKTGDRIVGYSDGIKRDEYLISVLGDSNGDGLFNQLDLADIRKHIVGWVDPETNIISKKTGIYYYGLDMNKDGVVNQVDLTRMRKVIVGLEKYE